jgi:adenine-specific DNA-methyltransferase
MKTINYMGSKKKLLPFLEECFSNYSIDSFFDAFSGSVRVANHFRHKYNVIINDKLAFSKVIGDAYMINNRLPSFYEPMINELNQLEPVHGWFSENYGGYENNGSAIVCEKTKRRGLWLMKNANKIDAIRLKIDDYEITDVEKSVLLLSLILASQKVSNSLGHHNGYLKEWAKNCYNDLELEVPSLDFNDKKHKTFCADIYEILSNVECDMTYFDPPYGTMNKNLKVATRYSSFYHIWDTLVLNHEPILFGRANKPLETKGWTPKLEKNEADIVIEEFKKLVAHSKSKYVAFSYSNQGLLSKEQFYELFNSLGVKNIDFYEKEHEMNNQTKNAFKDGSFINHSRKYESLKEYLFVVEK